MGKLEILVLHTVPLSFGTTFLAVDVVEGSKQSTSKCHIPAQPTCHGSTLVEAVTMPDVHVACCSGYVCAFIWPGADDFLREIYSVADEWNLRRGNVVRGGFATFGGYYPSSECVSQFQIVGPIQRFRPPAGAGGLIVAYQ